ncbi:YdcF family protein [Kribbella monticola]|uniref:YdcF family protein n=1 Tax=Kribbella monticola TaxID=2185285 RepID=UPI000DD2D572|nr:YdcF family protein [Kribbella monticola]
MGLRRVASWGVGGAIVLLLWGEYEHWRASRRRLAPAAVGGQGTEAVVVLGFRNPGARINAVNRWRVRVGLRSRRAEGASRLVLCGGPIGGAVSEAELMARYAREIRGYQGELALDTTSRSTWENIQNAVPLIEDAARIKIVSHSLHAEKARAYLHRLRPDLGARLVRGDDYRFGEWMLAKPFLAALGKRNLRRIRSQSGLSWGDPPASE